MDASQVIVRPGISEKSFQLVQAHNQYTFRVLDGAHQTEIRQAVEDLFDVTVTDARTVTVEAQAQAARRLARHPAVEEGDRRAEARTQDRALRGPSDQQCGSVITSPPRPAGASSLLGLRGGHQDEAGEVAHRGPKKSGGRNNHGASPPPQRRRPQAPVPHHRLQAQASTASPRRSPRSSTTPTAARTSPCCTTPTARSATSSRPRPARRRPCSGRPADIEPGNALALGDIPIGTIVHNIELQPGRGGQLVRAAGVGAS